MSEEAFAVIFAHVEEPQQLEDLREFLQQCGAKGLPAKFDNFDEKNPNYTAAIMQVIDACDVLGTSDKLQSAADVENVLSSIMSLVMISVDREKVCKSLGQFIHLQFESVFATFCAKLSSPMFTGTSWNSRAGAAVRVLSALFYGLEQHWCVKSQYVAYEALVEMCGRAGLINELPTELGQLNVSCCSGATIFSASRRGWTRGT